MKRLGMAELLEAQRKTAEPRFAHTEYWLSNPKADLRDDDSTESLLNQPDTTIAGRRDENPGLPITLSVDLSLEIKDLLLQAATFYGGTWEQASASINWLLLCCQSKTPRANIGYIFSILLLFEESAPWSDAASQILCRSEVVLPLSVPGTGMGLEHMKQVKVQLDRIEDYSLVNQQVVLETVRENGARAFGAIIDVKELDSVILLGKNAVPVLTLSNGPLEDIFIMVRGMSDAQAPISYQIIANSNLYSVENLQNLVSDMMNCQYRWVLAVLNKQPVGEI